MNLGTPQATAADLESLHNAIVTAANDAPDAALAMLEQFGALLRQTNVPSKHNYWNHFYYYKMKRLFEQRRFAEGLQLADEATSRNPSYAAAWLYKGLFESELGRPIDAFRSLKTAVRQKDDLGTIARLLQILFRRKRYRVAARIGRAVLASGRPVSASFRFLMAQIELQMRNGDAAVAHLDAYESLERPTDFARSVRRSAEALLAHHVRHVAIAGMSYVGSTLLGTLLGSLPGCAHAGETQELSHRANRKAYDFPIIDFDQDSAEAIPQCRICGAACPVFTREFRAELVRDPVDWYFRIGRRLGTRVLISSDKFLSQILRSDPLCRFDLIILYKPLDSWCYAHRREEARKATGGVARSPIADDLGRTLDYWANSYYGCLKDLRPQGRRLVINWDAFAAKPREHFEIILAKLQLPGSADAFENVSASHYVGGNDSIIPILKAGRVEFRPSRAGKLTPQDQEIVDHHAAAQSVYRLLDGCYRSDFRDLSEARQRPSAG
jgi:tetratricopeptide (TPR) repeat protein